jgi:hypothetical protein
MRNNRDQRPPKLTSVGPLQIPDNAAIVAVIIVKNTAFFLPPIKL